MKPTPKQRAKIYREAAEFFSTASWNYEPGFCWYLLYIKFKKDPKISHKVNDYPEILLFNGRGLYWLDTKNDTGNLIIPNHNQRIMCLLLAEQMALNPIFKL